jgi:hypothetical protein
MSKLIYGALWQMYRKMWFYTTKLFISAKRVPKLEISHCRKKLDLRKTKLFRDKPSSLCASYPNIYATQLKKFTIVSFWCPIKKNSFLLCLLSHQWIYSHIPSTWSLKSLSRSFNLAWLRTSIVWINSFSIDKWSLWNKIYQGVGSMGNYPNRKAVA